MKIIHPDGRTEEQTLPDDTDGAARLALFQHLVGGWVEAVYLDDDRLLIIDEEGKLKGRPRNVAATQLALDYLMPGDWICGTAVLTDVREFDGPEDGAA